MFAVAGAIGLFLYMRTYESTDDAEIDGNISNLSARITGVATAVYVEDNQYVKQGQLLAEIDPADLQVAVTQAEANLALAEAQGEAQTPAVPITVQQNRTTIATGGGDVAATSAQLAAAQKTRILRARPSTRRRRTIVWRRSIASAPNIWWRAERSLKRISIRRPRPRKRQLRSWNPRARRCNRRRKK